MLEIVGIIDVRTRALIRLLRLLVAHAVSIHPIIIDHLLLR